MVTSRLNHVSVLAHDLEESVRFYEDIFGMTHVPSPDFPSAEVEWLRVGDCTLHLFKRPEMDPVENYHFALWVDDFEEVHRTAADRNLFADFGSSDARVYELPDGAVQMYITDPAGNLLEVNHHDVTELDRETISPILAREEQVPQTGEAATASLFFDEFLADVERSDDGD